MITPKDAEICTGDCDYCGHRRTVPGTDARIDREPSYYCALARQEGMDMYFSDAIYHLDDRMSDQEIEETGFMTAAELKAYNMGFNDALDRVEELLRREQSAERLHNTAGRKAGERT